MLFDKIVKFKVVQILESGVVITNNLKGKKRDVNKDIEMFKQNAKMYEMFGEEGMIVWV